MAEAIELEKELERVILVGVSEDSADERETEESLEELAELVRTAGAVAVGTLVQRREKIHPGTYVGTGKVEELAGLIAAADASGIVCDDELSPAQIRNLENILATKIMDRTMVILDIFASHALTSEGKLQVELAQLKYRLTRLTGLGRSMSRLGGGIGTRGPGEKKLETDRRLIKDRIAWLNRELKEVVRHREITRAKREKNHVPVAAIVGYTNAGKSTLLNHLTGAEVLEEDKLFATLDPTTRELALSGRQQILLTDTVGFIRKLPHHLIEAFRSTLEEAKYADYILHVVDASNPQREKQMHIVYDTLDRLGVRDKKIVTLFNKQDLRTDDEPLQDHRADYILPVSAIKNEGLEEVKALLSDLLRENKIYVERTIPYDQAGILQAVRKSGELISEEYVPEGIAVKAYVPMELYGRM
ncbi:MAG: GTPase HflX [Blautia sp.]|nr:GTPase HflX [Blautia sp.]